MNVEKEGIKIVGKVSIIVPVYNVQGYIERCILSILEQTHSNLELILVNDGSSDMSGSICDEYSKKDNRVKVIHKENSGSSDSRNMGIDIATGDYLMFVDSDDYVNAGIVEHLISLGSADISVCGYRIVRDESVTIDELTDNHEILSLVTEEALSRLMYQKGLTNSPWAKLYKKELFDGIRFPSGKINQDLGTIYKVVARAEKVMVSDAPLYYYMQREGSVINSPFSLKRMAGLEFAHEQLSFIENNFPSLVKAAQNRLFTEAVSIYLKINDSPNSHNFAEEQERCWHVIREHRLSIIVDANSRIKPRVSAAVSYFGRSAMQRIGLATKKRVEGKL